MTLEPRAQPIQPREQHPLGDIGLVELVADLDVYKRQEYMLGWFEKYLK